MSTTGNLQLDLNGTSKLKTLASVNVFDNWLLPEVNKPPFVFKMALNHPVTADSGPDAYFKWAHPEIEYRTRIAVQGGRPPFRYEIITGPEGCVLGTGGRVSEHNRVNDEATGKTLHQLPEKSGWFRWTPTAEQQGQSFLCRVKITDQNKDSIFATWTITVDAGKFIVFNSTTGNNTNAGTLASPKQDFGAYPTMPTGKIGLFQSGTYTVSGPASYLSDSQSKMKSMIALDSGVIFNLTTAHFGASATASDIAMIGITFSGQLNQTTVHLFDMGGQTLRGLWWDCRWINVSETGNTSNNPACIFFANIASTLDALVEIPNTNWHRYITMCDCTVESSVVIQGLSTFSCKHVVFENNKQYFPAGATAPIYQAHFKDKTSHVTARYNYCSGPAKPETGGISFANQGTYHCFDQESCFNVCDLSAGTPLMFQGQATVAGNVGSGQPISARNMYAYRNTLIQRSGTNALYIPRWSYLTGAEPLHLINNIFVTAAANPISTANTNNDGHSLEGQNPKLALTDIDSNGSITGGSRVSYLGLLGAEIAF